ncbi:defensin-like peptide family protein [Acinetobacter sp. 479375]|uniref:hypothetical protein n=1 Tax=Acinetobacter ursingii TaxID=108980 RepID=UPI00044C98B2|nr:defensin-like peptide family protein [Acinetobacter sp. 479375]
MNKSNSNSKLNLHFLSGVCRHELTEYRNVCSYAFLSGVCRHEPTGYYFAVCLSFLSGVCRHERV